MESGPPNALMAQNAPSMRSASSPLTRPVAAPCARTASSPFVRPAALAALAALATAAPAAPIAAVAAGCPAPRGALVLRSTARAVIHAMPATDRRGRRVTYVGCLRATGRRTVLFRSRPDTATDQRYANGFTTDGPLVAFVTTSWSRYDDITGTLRIADLRTGRTSRVAIVTSVRLRFPQSAAERALNHLVLAASGTITWTTRRRGDISDVWVRDRAGVRRLESGAGPITRLRLTGRTVRWDRDGSERRSTLRLQ